MWSIINSENPWSNFVRIQFFFVDLSYLPNIIIKIEENVIGNKSLLSLEIGVSYRD